MQQSEEAPLLLVIVVGEGFYLKDRLKAEICGDSIYSLSSSRKRASHVG